VLAKLVCPNCHNTINDNPKKHRYRDKICNNCKKPYRTVGLHLPSFNLNWLRDKLFRRKELHEIKMAGYRGKAKKQLRMEMIAREDYELPTQEEIEKRATELFNADKKWHKEQQLKAHGRGG